MGGVNRRVSIGGATMQASKTDILYTKNVHAAKRSEDIAHLSPGKHLSSLRAICCATYISLLQVSRFTWVEYQKIREPVSDINSL